MNDPRNLINTNKCKLLRTGKLSTLCPGLKYRIFEAPNGEIYVETFSCQSRIAFSLADFNRISEEELERFIYSSNQSVVR